MNEQSEKTTVFKTTGDSSVDKLTCGECGTLLSADANIVSGTSVRCSRCGAIWTRGQAHMDRDRSAWWSLWLGLSSIVLLCFTGIPAMYLGIRSMLRMRHLRTRPADRTAAIAGASLGGFFGIVGAACVGSIGLGILMSVLTTAETWDPAEVSELVAETATIELPDGFQGFHANRKLGNLLEARFINVVDAKKAHVVITYYPPAMKGAGPTLRSTIAMPNLNILKSSRLSFDEDKKYDWQMAGQHVEVTRKIWRKEDPTAPAEDGDPVEEAIDYYSGYVATRSGMYAMAVSVHVPEALSESQVREIFASFGPSDVLKEAYSLR